ncbi:MAG: DNA-directed RNA polymerase subunit beta' [Fimbriimonadaceae bacterium]|nr:DNA-directed RNA polymerase subunit beta' [Fimbriimonadaceae bacterium]QYK55205.1 MAG: DNA-directed RNA polymerase subunit beta' [Fimbriimonadaceae bacterium]
MADSNLFDKIRIGVASPEDIKGWSYGEVKKPETINYRTFKPERDGLFCERIFGPTKDYECTCGRYKKIKYKGIVCERCGVEVTRSKVRRERMGHIELAAPVCHIWYLKGVPSPLALVLDISPRQLEKVIYFASFIIIELDSEKIQSMLPTILDAVEQEKVAIQAQMRQLEVDSLQRLSQEMVDNPDEYFDESFVRDRMKANFDRIRAEYRDADERVRDLDIAAELIGKLEVNQLIEEDKWRAISKMLDQVGRRLRTDLATLVRANIGAEAAKELLNAVDLDRMVKELRNEIVVTTSQKRLRAIKRLELVEALINSRSKPDWMVLDIVPVISPELRPMVQLDGGRFATSDLNDLYRRIINRNNRLKKIIEIQAPESIINHEKRLLQEAVDALIDNGRRSRPVVGSNQRPLKSLSDMLKGKEGRFRKNLLGKRVDYSGRSVIVVGPYLKLHQCGLPKEMALELFKPFVMKTLVERKITQNIKTAKRMIERMHPAVWDGLEDVIKEHPVLLNRAPTLHRLGIQAFEPILVEGKAIQLHPLVCHAYNADFDGDQMAVHVPLSIQAQAEARVLMLSTQNLFSPADGRPVCSPIQDIVLGCYALTYTNKASAKRLQDQVDAYAADPEKNPAPYVYSGPDEVLFRLESPNSDRIGLNDPVRVRLKRPIFRPKDEVDYRDPQTGVEYKIHYSRNEFDEEIKELVPLPQEFETFISTTTPGRLIHNLTLPFPMRFSDKFLQVELTKRAIADTIVTCHREVGTEGTIKLLDDMKALGFKWATKYGISIALTDMDPPRRRQEMLDEADNRSDRILEQFRRGLISFREMQDSLVRLWAGTYDEVGGAIVDSMRQENPLSIITVSGARGSIKQLTQLSGMRGLMFNQFNEVIYELPVRNSFQKGLSMLEFFVTTHGARKGLADTALRTADAGYLTRRLVDVAQDVIIRKKDCGTTEGILACRLTYEGKTIETISDRAEGRMSLTTVSDPETGDLILPFDELITSVHGKKLDAVETRYSDEREALEDDDKAIENLNARYESFGFKVDDHGRLGILVRSPISCELDQGICAKCYGVDLASHKVVEEGVAVGIIAAQSIGEPGTQLTMRTFHTGGVAGSKNIARTNQYKTGKFVRQFQEDFQQATQTDLSNFDPGKLLQDQENTVRELFSQPIGEQVDAPKKTTRSTKAAEKAAEKKDSDSRKLWERSRKTFFYSWTGESSGIVRVEEIFEARKQPRGKAIICPVTGTVMDVKRSSFGRWVVVEAEVPSDTPIRQAYIAQPDGWASKDGELDEKAIAALERLVGQKVTTQNLQALRKYGIERVKVFFTILVPPLGNLPVQKGQKVIKGDPLTEGPLDPHEVLDLAGAAAVHEYFIENLQSVYKDQGVDINDKHLEVIVRQMLRKRRVENPGNTPFLPGQIVDRFRFAKENERVRTAKASGKKVKYIDPIDGQEKEREPQEATATWILLGITEASLATDSFLSAASFQKTTRVLTEAAVRGKHDILLGLKENVIIGRLIPAGTGVKPYRELAIDVDRSQPSWSQQSLTALVEAEDGDLPMATGLEGMSLADLAAQAEEPAIED